MSLNKKHQNQLKTGIIAVFILALTLFIKGFFSKSTSVKSTSTDTTLIAQTPTNKSVIKNNTDQNISQSNQVNQNNGDVKNEFIAGDKKVYSINKGAKNKNSTPIINNGFLNQGGKGNTYNQQMITTPQQRHPTIADVRRIEDSVDKRKYPLYISYEDKESYIFGDELAQMLFENGFKILYMTEVMSLTLGTPRDASWRFTVDLNIPDTSYSIHILSQRK